MELQEKEENKNRCRKKGPKLSHTMKVTTGINILITSMNVTNK